MDIQPQLFRPGSQAPLLAELPLEQQVDLLAQQLKHQNQQLVVLHCQRAVDADVLASFEAQHYQLQQIAQETNQAASSHIEALKATMTEKSKECLAKDAEIAMLKAQLASQAATHTALIEAAQQTIDTQSKRISFLEKENVILTKAFKTTEKVASYISAHPLPDIDFINIFAVEAMKPTLNSLSLQVRETRNELQKNIQDTT